MVSSKGPLPIKTFTTIDEPFIGSTINLRSNLIIDWRVKGKVTSVKNQGFSCDSCYAFVANADL